MKAEKIACALSHKEVDWNAIDWRTVNRNVRRLQVRIVKATQEGRWGKVKALQHLLTHSYSGKAYGREASDRKSRQEHTGGGRRETGTLRSRKPQQCRTLRQRGYQPETAAADVHPQEQQSEETRPLGIPTMQDRAMQALYLLALDPVAETTADS